MSRTHKITDHKEIGARPAEKTGIYIGPGGDFRFYKAGADVAPTYKFSHPRGAVLTADLQKKRDGQIADYRKRRAERLEEARLLQGAK